jgi:hypothetical protein
LAPSLTFPDGTCITLPQDGPAEEASAEALYKGLSAEGRARVELASAEMAETYYNGVVAISPQRLEQADGTGSLYGLMPSANQVELGQAVSKMESTYRGALRDSSPTDLHQLGEPDPAQIDHNQMIYALTDGTADHGNVTNRVMLAGIGTLYNQLLGFSGQVRNNLDAKKDLQADMLAIRETLDEWPDGAQTQPFSWTEYTETGEVVEHVDEPLSKEQAEHLLAQLDAQQAAMQDTSTMDQFHLQMMLQGYAQAKSTFSEIIAMQHKTLSAIIGNLKA